MNSLKKALPPTVYSSMYVDDGHLSFKSRNKSIGELQVQLGVKKLPGWAEKNGFKLSPGKGTCVFRNRGIHPDPAITLYGVPIPVKKEHKFLGSVFGDKLTFITHIK